MEKTWTQYEREFKLWSKLTTFKKRVNKTKTVIKEALALNLSWYIAWSGGKDSTVMIHLIKLLCPDIPSHTQIDDIMYPGIQKYLETTSEKFEWNNTIHIPKESNFEKIKKDNIDITNTVRFTWRNKKITFDEVFWEHIEKMEKKYEGCFLGLRTEESRGRFFNYAKRGITYQLKSGHYMCCPLALWSGYDIFAYLIANDIPVFHLYKKCKFTHPTKIRLCWYLPGQFSQRGHVVALRYYFPEIYNKLIAVCPNIRNYD